MQKPIQPKLTVHSFPILAFLLSVLVLEQYTLASEPMFAPEMQSTGKNIQSEKTGLKKRGYARIATLVNTRAENIGARRLHTIMSTLLEEILFDVPEKKVTKIEIDANHVKEMLKSIVEDEDLSKYIL